MPLEGLRQGFTIAVSGKGGVGKTALSALLVRTLSRLGAVLAIDADPDSNLPQALGLDVETTVG
ncbi:MAG: AAA family ATPase, partial [Dehalococcoidia bacterium]|nr:AAA family ATPase [Dehalococcoidia bacterium]